MTDEAFGGVNLVLVCGSAGLLKALFGSRLALASQVGNLFLLPTFVAGLAGLEVVLLERTLLLVIVVLQLLPGDILLLLFSTSLVGCFTESLQVLESLVLLSLKTIQLGLELCVSVAQCLRLGVIEELLLLGDLGLDVVDGLLLRIETRKVLARLVERRDLR